MALKGSSSRCVASMLRQVHDEGLSKRTQILKFIGERFRVKVQLPEWYLDARVAEHLIE